MPRYKCKVDLVYTYDIEINALDKEDALMKSEYADLNNLSLSNLNREIAEVEELPEIAALFTYPTLPENASDRMKEAYKVMVEEIELASKPVMDNSLIQETKEVLRKQSDTTKITQQMFDIICNKYVLYRLGKLPNINSSQKFTEFLNDILGLNKSRSVYSKIWCGGVARESLPKGE